MISKQYTQEELESFVEGLIKMNGTIERTDPHILLAPMMGAIPLIDGLRAVNPYFEHEKVFYVPASSSIQDLNHYLPETVKEILLKEAAWEDKVRIMSLDEVVSGNSAVRVRKRVRQGIKKALTEVGFGSLKVDSRTQLIQIGLEHELFLQRRTKGKPRQRSKQYEQLVTEGEIIPIPIKRIITMDNPVFCPVRYQIIEGDQRTRSNRCTPFLDEKPCISREYITLMEDIAITAGQQPGTIQLGIPRIFEHQRYIPTE
tara:strand:- start:33 stop:806 length:774 start_codon:yes stop_codon:yes gene_type:complete